ncbi:MAG: XRE family transcriptional regulator [Candidatus Aminicenantes bacterium]
MRELGSRLRRLREDHLLTQDELARKVGLSPKFISSIERGDRQPSLDSLVKLAGFFKVGTSSFLEEEVNVFDQLEKEHKNNKVLRKELEVFRKCCEDYLKIEKMSGRSLEEAPVYQHQSPAEMARDERRRLGLGDEPVRDVFSLAELNGLRIFRQKVDPAVKLAGVFVHIESSGASFAMINTHQKLGLQAVTAAHIYAHYLKDRRGGPVIDNPDIFMDEYLSLYPRREQFACLFAAYFLMPEEKIRSIIQKEWEGREIRYEQVVFLKRYFGVNTDTMLRHLNRLRILSYVDFMQYQKIDPVEFEKSLFNDRAGREEFQVSIKKKTLSSDRYKILAVSVLQDEGQRKKMKSEE